jgi:hypothetical protein
MISLGSTALNSWNQLIFSVIRRLAVESQIVLDLELQENLNISPQTLYESFIKPISRPTSDLSRWNSRLLLILSLLNSSTSLFLICLSIQVHRGFTRRQWSNGTFFLLISALSNLRKITHRPPNCDLIEHLRLILGAKLTPRYALIFTHYSLAGR